MNSTVSIAYTGIVSLVPAPSTNSYRVVIQNGRNWHHEHFAFLCLPPSRSEVPKELGPQRKTSKDGSLAAWYLEGWDVEIVNRIVSPSLRVEPDFFRYVLHLSEGCHPAMPGCDRFNGYFLRVDDRDQIAARLEIRQGTLAAGFVRDDVEWRWEDYTPGWKLLAQEVVHRFEIAEPELMLRLKRGDEIAQVAISQDSAGRIDVLVGNTMKGDIFPHAETPPEPAKDDHVRMYYDVSALNYPAALRRGLVPRKVARFRAAAAEERADARRVNGTNCPPGLWTS